MFENEELNGNNENNENNENNDTKGYERVDSISTMKQLLSEFYVLKDLDIDRKTGYTIATFDMDNKYDNYMEKSVELNRKVHIEKLFNPEQVNFYLGSKFGCTVVDVGSVKKKTKNGYKNFVYVKFLVDEKLMVPKKIWIERTR
jgi:hypothetical protein